MNKTKKQRLKNKILTLEEIISSPLSLDKDIKLAQYKIENIMSALSLEEMLELDDFIMSKQLKNI